METPLPLVTKPIISSPGTGLQHLENLTDTSSIPATTIPFLERTDAALFCCVPVTALLLLTASSISLSAPSPRIVQSGTAPPAAPDAPPYPLPAEASAWLQWEF
mgnify:CR=1 FL=1